MAQPEVLLEHLPVGGGRDLGPHLRPPRQVVGVHQRPQVRRAGLRQLRWCVAEQAGQGVVDVDIAVLREVVNVEDGRARRRHPVGEAPGFGQGRLGPHAVGDVAHDAQDVAVLDSHQPSFVEPLLAPDLHRILFLQRNAGARGALQCGH